MGFSQAREGREAIAGTRQTSLAAPGHAPRQVRRLSPARRCDHPRLGRAARLTQENADVARELCLTCLHLVRHAGAVTVARLAMQITRSDPGLQANLALALLLAGEIDQALDQAEQAAARSPEDEINRNLLAIIREVKEGRRRQPATLAEVEA